MRIFKTRQFDRWAKKHDLADRLLINAVKEMNGGLIDADYGANLYKKRIATGGRGKSGGMRALIAYNIEAKAYFLYGFEKNERDNISEKEKRAYKILAKAVLQFSAGDIKKRLQDGSLVEIRS
ncbi:MAG: type II toxin-antitoxin system RelE/ParE family toxin [Gammaproteobacteria bacterium]|nr:type II toxin-antitoxin system RelE/ParE family toxin [Gammaproteobacteria bacterium]